MVTLDVMAGLDVACSNERTKSKNMGKCKLGKLRSEVELLQSSIFVQNLFCLFVCFLNLIFMPILHNNIIENRKLESEKSNENPITVNGKYVYTINEQGIKEHQHVCAIQSLHSFKTSAIVIETKFRMTNQAIEFML